MASLPRVILKKGREKPVLRGHPWVFSGAVADMEGEVVPGDVGDLVTCDGQWLGRGHINPASQIIFRLLTQEEEEIDASFFRRRFQGASRLREEWLRKKTNAYRMINGEGDFLPGLVVDRYGDRMVLQCSTAGMERVKGMLTDLLARDFHPQSIYDRSDMATRREEGLPQARGHLYGREIPASVEIEEHESRFIIDVKEGQKTGFYLDQRENRFFLREVAREKKVLDCFCYTGGFSIHAGLGGAKEITMIDSSEEALKRARDHFLLNRLERIPHHAIRGDGFEVMRTLDADYDIVVLDPPPFAKKKGHLPGASRGYKDLNLQAFRLLKRGGLLLTFSCSHHMGWDLFQKIVFSAAIDAGRSVQLLTRRGHPIDHPIHLSHPEGEYLRGLVCRVG